MSNRTLFMLGAAFVGVGVAATVMLSAARPSPPAPALASVETRELSRTVPAAMKVAGSGSRRAERPVELERLDARRELYESVDALVQASEFERARRLLDEDQARFGDEGASQWRDVEQSYRLIADCLERPTAQLRSRAQAFASVTEALGLKPQILSACRLPAR
jgi:hypothetical protein